MEEQSDLQDLQEENSKLRDDLRRKELEVQHLKSLISLNDQGRLVKVARPYDELEMLRFEIRYLRTCLKDQEDNIARRDEAIIELADKLDVQLCYLA